MYILSFYSDGFLLLLPADTSQRGRDTKQASCLSGARAGRVEAEAHAGVREVKGTRERSLRDGRRADGGGGGERWRKSLVYIG